MAWEDAIPGLGMAMSTVVSEKNREMLFIRQRVLQTVTSLRVVSLVFRATRKKRPGDEVVFRGHDLLKIANMNSQQEATLSLWKKIVPRESGGSGA